MIESLRFSDIIPKEEISKNTLDKYRREIDILDDILIDHIAKRMKIAKEIGNYKKDNNIKILQMNRWEEMLQNRVKIGEGLGVSSNFIRHFLEIIHQESIDIQTSIINNEK